MLPMSALLLVPMMIFAALAVDVGGWTVQANEAQAAADAAALAAAPLMPDQAEATTVARHIASLNGFEDGVSGVRVEVEFPDAATVRVTIGQPGERYLSDLVSTTPVTISRYADATALAPLGIGSPVNVLGFGPYSLGGEPAANYWILENNDCQVAHLGDLRAAQYLTEPWCGDGLGLPQNPYWKRASTGRDGGYFFKITIPPGVASSSTLMILDPGQCPGYGAKPEDAHWRDDDDRGTRISWRLWDTNGTPLIADDDSPASSWWSSDECAADLPYPSRSWIDKTQGWTETPFVFPPNTTGEDETYLIQSMVDDSTRRGWDHYSFWVRPGGGPLVCSSIGVDDCPTISADEWIPTRASGAAAGEPMALFLADVGPQYAGRSMQVHLWDVGEGMDNIQILDPLGNPLDFTWSSDDPVNHAPSNPSDDCSGIPCLWLDPTNRRYPRKFPYAGWFDYFRFDGRVVTLSVPLDTQVDFPAYAASGNGYWFSIRFQPTRRSVAKEWATFSVGISGDPIRLTD